MFERVLNTLQLTAGFSFVFSFGCYEILNICILFLKKKKKNGKSEKVNFPDEELP